MFYLMDASKFEGKWHVCGYWNYGNDIAHAKEYAKYRNGEKEIAYLVVDEDNHVYFDSSASEFENKLMGENPNLVVFTGNGFFEVKHVDRRNEAADMMCDYGWDLIAHYMDDEIREKLHCEISPCDDIDFLAMYMSEHFKKYNETFTI